MTNSLKETDGRGPAWVNNVLEKFHDFDDPVFNTIEDFVVSLDL